MSADPMPRMGLHARLGWGLAVAWLGAAVYLFVSFSAIERAGGYGVFSLWTPPGLVLAALTWLWTFGPSWNRAGALAVLATVVLSAVVLWLVGADGRVHFAARDAYYMREHVRAAMLQGALWLYLLHPIAVMAGGCLAIVEYLRHPKPWMRPSA